MIGVYRPHKELEKYHPRVFFIFEDTREHNEWRQYLLQIIINFLLFCNSKNKPIGNDVRNAAECCWNKQMDLDEILILDEHVTSCKISLHDGRVIDFFIGQAFRGIHFSSRENNYPLNTQKIFLIADAFEEYITERKISFKRFNSSVSPTTK